MTFSSQLGVSPK